jgi:hypothetical protein
MSSPSDDSELRKYSPKWAREQPATSERLRSVSTSTSIAPWSEDEHRDRRIMPLRPESVPEPPAWWADGLLALIGRLVTVAAFAAVIALLVMFGKPLLQRVAVLEPDSPPTQVAKPSDPLTENEAPATRALVPTAGIVATPGAAPRAAAQGQQAVLLQMGESRALRYAALVMAPPAWLSTITGTKSAHKVSSSTISQRRTSLCKPRHGYWRTLR